MQRDIADNLDTSQLKSQKILPNLKRTYVSNFLIFRLSNLNCGGYRSRTDDPLRARQML